MISRSRRRWLRCAGRLNIAMIGLTIVGFLFSTQNSLNADQHLDQVALVHRRSAKHIVKTGVERLRNTGLKLSAHPSEKDFVNSLAC